VARTSATRPSSTEEVWIFVLTIFFLSRLLFLGVGSLAATYLPWAEPAGDPLEPPGFLNYWAHWDGAWYSEIATDGYGGRSPTSTTFFPLYPMLVRLGISLGGGPALWGVLISLLAAPVALFFLYRIAENLYDTRAARAATLSFAFFPTAFFLNAVYTEALFLALSAGALWAALVRRNLLLAGLLGSLAAATRNLGVILLLPLLSEWLRYRREFGLRGLAGVALVPAGLLGYAAFLWGRFGNPLVFASQQDEYWGREFTNPFTTLGDAWQAARDGARYLFDPETLFLNTSATPALDASNTLNFAFLILFLFLLAIGFVVLPPGLSLYNLFVVLLPVLTPAPAFPLMSLPRFMLAAFPVFLVLGYLLTRARPVLVLWLLLSTGTGVALTTLFTTWRWIA
jgi:Dolichyl-phosphate-mannose-protein mannosyltransferase